MEITDGTPVSGETLSHPETRNYSASSLLMESSIALAVWSE